MKVSRSNIAWASLSLLALAGCPVTGDDLCAGDTCTPLASNPTEGGAPTDAGADAIIEQPTDPCVDKPTAEECLTNASALFVSATASPAGADGTIEHPFPTITAAVQKVTNDKRRIYVCEGTYPEQVALEGLPKTLIGGFTCDFHGKGAKAKIAPSSGIALSIAAVGGTSLIDIAVEGTSTPNTAGASSVAMFITRATNTLLRGVDVKALEGQPGLDAPPTTVNNWDTAVPFATNANGGAGGPPPSCGKCKDMTYSYAGGGGSTAGAGGGFPEAGAAQPPAGGNIANNGGNAVPCIPGDAGAHGDPGAKGAGAQRPGKLEQSSWNTDTTSKPGGSGGPGQGGGGGGANSTEGGGSGGCGGCGGAGGASGGNGGSSIALLVYQSVVKIEASTFTASNGGKGGKGANGLTGQPGRTGGGGSCQGGVGGTGAGGGGGGGGAGGYSIAVAHVGNAPTLVDTKLLKGTGGPAGIGGEGGPSAGGTAKVGDPGDPGKEGAAEEMKNIE